jgi:hypothetical protein
MGNSIRGHLEIDLQSDGRPLPYCDTIKEFEEIRNAGEHYFTYSRSLAHTPNRQSILILDDGRRFTVTGMQSVNGENRLYVIDQL